MKRQERLIEVLKKFDGRSGNKRLQQALGWNDLTYLKVKENLLDIGLITVGRGNGGSVLLVDQARDMGEPKTEVFEPRSNAPSAGITIRTLNTRKSVSSEDIRQRAFRFDSISGVSFPIAFRCKMRGKTYQETIIYFSFNPLVMSEEDIFDRPKDYRKMTVKLFENSEHGRFDCLVPYKIKPVVLPEYESRLLTGPNDRLSITLVDDNPTTATERDRIGLMPCTFNNIDTFLELFSFPSFFIAKDGTSISLRVKDESGVYRKIPSQVFSLGCDERPWHRKITFNGNGTPPHYAEFDWPKIYEQIRSRQII